MVRKGEIVCYNQFLLFSQCFFTAMLSLAHQNQALCGNGLTPLNNKMFALSKLKYFTDYDLTVAHNINFVFERVENIVGTQTLDIQIDNNMGKVENAGYRQFLLSLPDFEKPPSLQLLTLSQRTNFRLFQIERVCRRQIQIC